MKTIPLLLTFLIQTLAFAADGPRSSWKITEAIPYQEYTPQLSQSDLRNVGHLNAMEFSDILRKNGGSGTGEIFLPIEVNNRGLLALAAATSLGLVVFKNDAEIMDYVQEHKSQVPQGIMDFGNTMGTAFGIGPVLVGSYFLGVVFENEKLKKIGLITIAAELATGIVTESFKNAFARVRPRSANGPYEFFVSGNKSFFSGHTSGAFSLATIISEVYGEEYPVVPYLAYGVAAITAYARMHSHAHWGSDVFVGAIAGHIISKIVYRMLNPDDNHKANPYLSITPSFDVATKEFWITVNYTPKAWRPRSR